MKALVQRVLEARVEVAGETVGAIGPGLLVLLCVEPADDEAVAARIAGKVARLRIFEDGAGKMNLSVLDTGGEALVVSQFTLAADIRRGNRPDFTGAAPPQRAERLCGIFGEELRRLGLRVATGRFGAHMRVHIVLDGPVTIWIDSAVLAGCARGGRPA